MTVNGEKVDCVRIVGDNGVCVNITDTEKGNLRITEVGQYLKTLQVIPQNSNSIIISSTREMM